MEVNLEKVYNNAAQLNTDQREYFIELINEFEDLFVGTLGSLDTEPVDLELKPGSKTFNVMY